MDEVFLNGSEEFEALLNLLRRLEIKTANWDFEGWVIYHSMYQAQWGIFRDEESDDDGIV
jgi:hypothetical protein